MPIRPGNNPNAPKLYVGNQEVNRVYAGTTMVWENSSPISLTIDATRTMGIAPAGIQFVATATSPAARCVIPYHDIEYVWSFDDPGNYRYLDNSPLFGVSRNKAHGPVVSHIFSAPGTYTVSCTAHDGENPPKTTTIEVTIDNPDTVCAGADTAVVSLSSNFAGKPTGASEFSTIAAARAHLAGRANQQLLLRRGEVHPAGFTITETSGTGRRIFVGAFGSGANPLISMPSSNGHGITMNVANGVADEIAIHDIDHLGNYDPTSTSPPAGTSGGLANFKATNKPFAAHKTVWGCHTKNSGDKAVDISTNGTPLMENFFAGDCWFDGWRDYGILVADGGKMGFEGIKWMQPQGTRNGALKGTSPLDWPDHGPIRVSRPTGPFSFHNIDFVSLNSWSSGSDKYDIQPSIRWSSGASAGQTDQKLNVDRIRAEGGGFNLINETTNTLRRNEFILMDRAYIVLSTHQSTPIGHGGTTVRNTLFVVPNTKSGGTVNVRNGAVEDTSYPFATGLSNANLRRVELYSCAIIDIQSDQNSKNRAQTSDPRAFAFPSTAVAASFYGNNLGYAPNRTTVAGFTGHNPVSTANGAWTPIYDGERFEATAFDSSTGYGVSTVATYKPLTGSPAIGGALGKVSLVDFDGNLRQSVLAGGLSRSTPSIGPYEPPLES